MWPPWYSVARCRSRKGAAQGTSAQRARSCEWSDLALPLSAARKSSLDHCAFYLFSNVTSPSSGSLCFTEVGRTRTFTCVCACSNPISESVHCFESEDNSETKNVALGEVMHTGRDAQLQFDTMPLQQFDVANGEPAVIMQCSAGSELRRFRPQRSPDGHRQRSAQPP